MRIHPHNFQNLRRHSRGYLPHWQLDNSFYSITYRLSDSLPHDAVIQLTEERKRITRRIAHHRDPTFAERASIARLFGVVLDRYLDAGYGACFLRRPDIADLIAENLKHFDGARYQLHAWCVMPNHVHVVMFLERGETLPKVLHSWKSYTSHKANEMLGRSGEFWKEEYFDRIIRDAEDLVDTTQYVLANPANAGLKNWSWVWARE